MIRLGEADSGISQSIPVGSEVLLVLPENPTTGFRWQFTLAGAGVFELTEDRFDSSGGGLGGGGARSVRFVARGPGAVRVAAVYKQAWSPETGRQLVFELVAT